MTDEHAAERDPLAADGPGADATARLAAERLAAERLAAELDIDVMQIEAEERAAARRRSMIEAGRRKGGVFGAAAAGAMIGLRDIYIGPPPTDDIVIEVEASGEPTDIDVDGISATVDDVEFWAPPPRNPDD